MLIFCSGDLLYSTLSHVLQINVLKEILTQALYSDASDLSDAVPSLPAYNNNSITLALPVKEGKQMTWANVSWLALYCRKVSMLFMSVNIPSDFESSE